MANPTTGGRSKRIGDMVLYRSGGKTFARPAGVSARSRADAHAAIRAAFAVVSSIWRGEGGVHHACWEKAARGGYLNGYSAFMGANICRARKGEGLALFRGTGIKALASLDAVPAPRGGGILVSFLPALRRGEYLTLFVQPKCGGMPGLPVMRREFGEAPVSPLRIDGLTPGTDYFVYGVVTNAPYADADRISSSVWCGVSV